MTTEALTQQRLEIYVLAQQTLYDHMKHLEGSEKREAVRAALKAGITPTRLADGLGISRSRLYQLKEGKQS